MAEGAGFPSKVNTDRFSESGYDIATIIEKNPFKCRLHKCIGNEICGRRKLRRIRMDNKNHHKQITTFREV